MALSLSPFKTVAERLFAAFFVGLYRLFRLLDYERDRFLRIFFRDRFCEFFL